VSTSLEITITGNKKFKKKEIESFVYDLSIRHKAKRHPSENQDAIIAQTCYGGKKKENKKIVHFSINTHWDYELIGHHLLTKIDFLKTLEEHPVILSKINKIKLWDFI